MGKGKGGSTHLAAFAPFVIPFAFPLVAVFLFPPVVSSSSLVVVRVFLVLAAASNADVARLRQSPLLVVDGGLVERVFIVLRWWWRESGRVGVTWLNPKPC